MHNSLFVLSLCLLLSLISCQTYIDVNVCHGFDSTSSIQVTVSSAHTGLPYTQTLLPAKCVTFTGIGSAAGQQFTISASGAYNIPPSTSTTFALSANSCYNTYVLVYTGLYEAAITIVNPNGVVNGATTTVSGSNIHMVIANYASDSFQGSPTLQYGRSFSSLNFTAATTTGGAISLGPVDDFAAVDGHPQTMAVDMTGPLSLMPTFAAQGIYRNVTGSHLELPVTFYAQLQQNQWPTIPILNCFYMMLYGSAGNNFDGSGYRFISSGGVTQPLIGYVFSNTGSAPNNATIGGPSSSTGVSGSTGPTTPTPSPSGGNSGFSTANFSPLLFIAIVVSALVATRF